MSADSLAPLLAIVGLTVAVAVRFWLISRRRRMLVESFKADPARRARQGT